MESIIQDPNVQALIGRWKEQGREQGREEGRVQGREEGRDAMRSALHRVLAARSFTVTPDVRSRIDSEPDITRLQSWIEAAATATSIGDVFRDG